MLTEVKFFFERQRESVYNDGEEKALLNLLSHHLACLANDFVHSANGALAMSVPKTPVLAVQHEAQALVHVTTLNREVRARHSEQLRDMRAVTTLRIPASDSSITQCVMERRFNSDG